MIYVGIDIASQKHNYFMMSNQGEIYTKDSNVCIGLESTGFYHLNIVSYLLRLDYKLMLINPLLTNMYKKSKKVHIAKNDNIDSKYICKYLQDTQTVFKPYTITSYHTEALKALSRERFSLVNELRLDKINIYKLVTQIFPEFLKLFSNIYQGSALEILEKYNNPSKLAKAHLSTISALIHGRCSITASKIIEVAKTSIGIKSEHLYFLLKHAIKRLKSIKEQIYEYDEQIKYYVDLINPKILTVPGIGYTTAGLILGELGDVKRFKSSEQIVSFAGLDIMVYESGKYKATNISISKKGSVYLRYALYQAAKVCWRFDPMFNKYYLKKQSENKHFYVILGHLEKKLVKVIYSVLKNNTDYFIPQN